MYLLANNPIYLHTKFKDNFYYILISTQHFKVIITKLQLNKAKFKVFAAKLKHFFYFKNDFLLLTSYLRTTK